MTRSSVGWPATSSRTRAANRPLLTSPSLRPNPRRMPRMLSSTSSSLPCQELAPDQQGPGPPAPAATCGAPAGTSPCAAAGRCRARPCGRVWMAPGFEGNARFGADHCSRSCVRPICAASRPLALMGVRGPSVHRSCGLEDLDRNLDSSRPIGAPDHAITSLPFASSSATRRPPGWTDPSERPAGRDGQAAAVRLMPGPSGGSSHLWPSPPRRCAPSCWRAPPPP